MAGSLTVRERYDGADKKLLAEDDVGHASLSGAGQEVGHLLLVDLVRARCRQPHPVQRKADFLGLPYQQHLLRLARPIRPDY